MDVTKTLRELLGPDGLKTDVDAARCTTFQTGGRIRYYACPKSTADLSLLLAFCERENHPFFVLGNGSNVLVDDAGYSGIVISLRNCCTTLRTDGCHITAGAALTLKQVAETALAESLTGFEFAAGIPGTVGGAIYMNAGAYGGEMKNVVTAATVMDRSGTTIQLQRSELAFRYRGSTIKDRHYVVLDMTCSLIPGDADGIRSLMDDLAQRRNDKQPLDKPSAGSTFKRPEGHFAGKLIMEAGLMGTRIGGAMVSGKHAGFIVNEDHATATDIIRLIEHVQSVILEKNGISLVPEVIILKD